MSSMTSSKTVLVVVLVIGIVLGASVAGVLVSVLDLSLTQPQIAGEIALFEDGSFTIAVGGRALVGCIPFSLCSEIGVDSPWEDFVSEPFSGWMYLFIDAAYKK